MTKAQRTETGRKRPIRNDSIPRHDVVRLRALRLTTRQIAAELGAAADTISDILHEPEVIAQLEELERDALDDAKQVLRTGTRRASRVLFELLDSPDERVRLDAAKTLLTKAGADAPTKAEVGGDGFDALATALLAAKRAVAPEEPSDP